MIPKLLPSLWRELGRHALDSNTVRQTESPSKAELRQAIELLKSNLNLRFKHCLFLDGLDELAGDHSEGIALIRTLSEIENVKVIVSSRPVSLCYDAFSSGPHLRLQDLTRHDISLYIQDHVGSHPYMVALSEDHPEAAAGVIRTMIERASGVFLWVVLACKSIREGLANFDSIQELQERVAELPPQLEDLFVHILSRCEPAYRPEAAKLLKLVYANACSGRGRICIFALSLASDIWDCRTGNT